MDNIFLKVYFRVILSFEYSLWSLPSSSSGLSNVDNVGKDQVCWSEEQSVQYERHSSDILQRRIFCPHQLQQTPGRLHQARMHPHHHHNYHNNNSNDHNNITKHNQHNLTKNLHNQTDCCREGSWSKHWSGHHPCHSSLIVTYYNLWSHSSCLLPEMEQDQEGTFPCNLSSSIDWREGEGGDWIVDKTCCYSRTSSSTSSCRTW